MSMFDETAEEKLIRALQFVKVTVDDSGPDRSGHLTDASIAMILVEIKRSGLIIEEAETAASIIGLTLNRDGGHHQ